MLVRDSMNIAPARDSGRLPELLRSCLHGGSSLIKDVAQQSFLTVRAHSYACGWAGLDSRFTFTL